MADFGQRLENLVRVFEDEAKKICGDADDFDARKEAYIDQLEARIQVADRSILELRDRTLAAEKQLSEVLERQSLRDLKNARLLSRLQVIKDQFAELESGDEMADRSAAGQPITNEGVRKLMEEIGETVQSITRQSEGGKPRNPGRLGNIFGRSEPEHSKEVAIA